MSMTIPCNVEFDERKLSDILITAFEGGVGYWCHILKYQKPEGAIPPTEIADMEKYKHGWLPLVEGGGLWLQDTENPGENDPDAAFPRVLLDRAALQRGLEAVALKRPKIWLRICEDQYDSCDADIVIQYAVLGEEMFG